MSIEEGTWQSPSRGGPARPREQAIMERAFAATRTRQTHDVLIELPHGELPPGMTYDALLTARITFYRDGGNHLAADSLSRLLAWAMGNQK